MLWLVFRSIPLRIQILGQSEWLLLALIIVNYGYVFSTCSIELHVNEGVGMIYIVVPLSVA